MLYLAIAIGIIFCSFWVAQIIFVRRHLKWTEKLIPSGDIDKDVGVSIIHPIKDLDYEFEKNLESWMNQNYCGPVQHIFSFQDPKDPAIKVVKKFIERYPEIDMTITVNPIIPGLNGKSSNMVHGMKLAKYDIVLFGDSDVRVKPDFIVKMVRPLKDENVGITTCGQVNIGGRDFWTRFFTFIQNSETDFMWAFFTKIGMDVGATGAAFGMRKQLLKDIGGLEAFGGSLLEDLHLGNTLYRMGYKLELGPFIECHVDKLAKEKSLNYAKRIAVGIKTHIAFELPTFLLILFWYWALLLVSLIMRDKSLLILSLIFIALRIVHGLAMRVVTKNKIMPVDFIMGPVFDIFGTCALLYAFKNPCVLWRGIEYEVRKGGYIEGINFVEEIALEEQVAEEDY
ncbi:MAG TPA: glycosyltransferase [Clostridiaceae bacterium]|nr:glycosyltransferase [Clostridiaceae bacterium]